MTIGVLQLGESGDGRNDFIDGRKGFGEPNVEEVLFLPRLGNLIEGSRKNHFPLPHKPEGVAGILDLGKHMGGKKDGLSLSGKGLEDVAQVDARLRVEVGRRFIEQKNGWLVHKSLGEQGPLAHAPGERSAEGLHVIL